MSLLLAVVGPVSALCLLMHSTFIVSCPMVFHLQVTPASMCMVMGLILPYLSALYSLDHILCSLDLSCSEYYEHLHVLEPALGPDAPVCTHMDGGSQATMCPHVDLLSHLCMFLASAHGPTLHVADACPHYLTGEGYLCVPDMQGGCMLIWCFYIPSLPATILSLDAAGCELGCQSWSCFSHFFGGLYFVWLHHCHHTSGDHVLLATPICIFELLVPPINSH